MLHQDLKFNKRFFCDLWSLLKPYWTSEEKWSAWVLLFLNILCVCGEVRASVGFNHFHKIFYDALEKLDGHAIFGSFQYLLVVCFCLAMFFGGAVYFNGVLSIRWRRWLTKNYLQKWLENHNHYRIQTLNKYIDNPDQRISEDLEKFPEHTLHLFLGPYKFLHSMLMLFSFGYILWELSAKFSFHFGHSSYVIPGYLCWIAFLYAAFGTWIMCWLGKKLSFLDYQQQLFNADFRFGLVRFREASEQVSLYRGESVEHDKFNNLFSRIFNNFIDVISLKTRLTLFNKIYGFSSYFIGLALSIPFFLAKVLTLGTVMQISSAYNSVTSGFSVLMDAFMELSEWRAVIHRLAEFSQVIESLGQETVSDIQIKNHQHPNIQIENLQLRLPSGEALLGKINLTIPLGQSVLINGPSGVGKSTLLRALAGLWSYGEGKIYFPTEIKTSFLPQKSYLPLGSLKDILCYPHENNVSDNALEKVLDLCALGKLKSQINHIKNWGSELSYGEQQLIALARLFLHLPDVVFLDEATSAIDETTEAQVYSNLKQYLPNLTVISVGHRSSLCEFHDRVIDVVGRESHSSENSSFLLYL